MREKRVALIGYGALGKILTGGIREKLNGIYRVSGVWELRMDLVREAIEREGFKAYGSFEELLEDCPDYVVEIASAQAVAAYGTRVLEAGCDLVVTSVGALADDGLYRLLRDAARSSGRKVHLTSGAVGGFDVLKTIAAMGGASGRIENYKAPASLNGAPHLEGRELPEDRQERIFDGTAREAIVGFPKNVNVAVASALASVGVDRMQVTIDSCPGMEDNVHKIVVENHSVTAVVEIASRPDADNPKSSVMTAWSVVALLANLADPVQFF